MAIGIDDPDDPRIAAFRQVRERDLVGREGRFIAEGEVVLRVLLGSTQCRAVSVLVDERRLSKLAPLLDSARDVPVYAAAQGVIDAIAGFHLHRGILALGEPISRTPADELLAAMPGEALVVGVMGVGNHDNIGGIFRNAAVFGADAVIVGTDCCDPFYRKAIRVSVGASLSLPWAKADDVAGALRAAGFEVLALSPRGREAIGKVRRRGRTAILLGAEGPGLPDEVLARARSVRIPMAGRMDSLNVATACAVALERLTNG